MITMMESCRILCLFILVIGPVLGQMDTTYHISSSSLHCKKCSPGHYWIADCTSDGQQDQCLPCPAGTYQPDFNIAHFCAPCATECSGNNGQEVRMVPIATCTSTFNLKCRCIVDYWMEQGRNPVCRSVSPCPPGKGVLKLADEYNNTTCETCRPGLTYSNVSSKNESCQNCSVCGEDQVEASSCNAVNDTVCISREQQHGLPTGIIIGIVLGTVIAIALVAILIGMWCKRRNISVLKQLCVRGNECAGDTNSQEEGRAMVPTGTGNWPDLFSDVSLMRLSTHIGAQWRLIGIELGLEAATLDHIQMNSPNRVGDQICNMLLSWRNQQLVESESPSFEMMKVKLVEALRQWEGTLAHQLERLNIENTFPV